MYTRKLQRYEWAREQVRAHSQHYCHVGLYRLYGNIKKFDLKKGISFSSNKDVKWVSRGSNREARPRNRAQHKKEEQDNIWEKKQANQAPAHNKPAGQWKAGDKEQRSDTWVLLKNTVSCCCFPWLPLFRSLCSHSLHCGYGQVVQTPSASVSSSAKCS